MLKKNQMAIVIVALMLITAGYLNYTTNESEILTSGNTQDLAAIGDATLVNSNEILEENTISTNEINTASEEVKEEDNYFVLSRLDRDKMYSQMIETYQKLIESQNISQEQKAISQQEIANINQIKNAIMICENLIKNKGFEDLVIFVNDGTVDVVVKSENLQAEKIAQIQNIIIRELKVDAGNIHISNKK